MSGGAVPESWRRLHVGKAITGVGRSSRRRADERRGPAIEGGGLQGTTGAAMVSLRQVSYAVWQTGSVLIVMQLATRCMPSALNGFRSSAHLVRLKGSPMPHNM